MREELLAVLENQRAEPDMQAAATFRYEALGGELVVAGVFVRIFNEQSGFAVQDPVAFCKVIISLNSYHSAITEAAYQRANDNLVRLTQ